MSAEALIDAFAAAWSSKDPAAFVPLCAPDVHYEDPLTAPLTGPGELARHAGRLWAAFPDARLEQAGPRMTAERHVAAPLRLVATHRGELEGLPPTGRFLSAHLVVVCELGPEEDVLWRVRAFFDPYDAGVQLGVLPERGSFGGKALLMLRGFGLRARG
jgi:predicted ester cyclase